MSEDTPQFPPPEQQEQVQPQVAEAADVAGDVATGEAVTQIPVNYEDTIKGPVGDSDPATQQWRKENWIHDPQKAEVMAHAEAEGSDPEEAGRDYEIDAQAEKLETEGREAPDWNYVYARELLDFGSFLAERSKETGDTLSPNQEMLAALNEFVKRMENEGKNPAPNPRHQPVFEPLFYDSIAATDGYKYSIDLNSQEEKDWPESEDWGDSREFYANRNKRYREDPREDPRVVFTRTKEDPNSGGAQTEIWVISPWKRPPRNGEYGGVRYFIQTGQAEKKGLFAVPHTEYEGRKESVSRAEAQAFKEMLTNIQLTESETKAA